MLTTLRQRRRLSQGDVAERLEIERSYYGRLERGDRPFSVPLLMRALEVLGASDTECLSALRFYGGIDPNDDPAAAALEAA